MNDFVVSGIDNFVYQKFGPFPSSGFKKKKKCILAWEFL